MKMYYMECEIHCFITSYGDNQDLHVRTHSFPPRRHSDLIFGDLHRRFEIGIGKCHAISVRRVTQINLIPEFHMQSRQHLLGQYNARAVADLDKFQRLVHTDVITLKGGVEELLNPSANPDRKSTRLNSSH